MKQIHLWRQWGPGFRAYPKLIEPREPKFALVDDADYPWLSQWDWYVMGPGNDLAVRCVLRIGDGLRTGYMHRMIMEAYHGPDLRHVKHLDGNLLNNQRFNLRWKATSPGHPSNRCGSGCRRDSGSEVIKRQQDKGNAHTRG